MTNIDKSDIGILCDMLNILYEHDCKPLAWRLIERFGTVSAVFGATKEELMRIDGMTERVAVFFTFLRPLYRQALLRYGGKAPLDSERAVVEYAAAYFVNEYAPSDVCVCLDKKRRIIRAERIGGREKLREIVAAVCKRNADCAVILRFDPALKQRKRPRTDERGMALPELLKLFRAIDTELVDYVEYAPYKFFSLRRAIDGDERLFTLDKASDERFGGGISEAKAERYFAKSKARPRGGETRDKE